MLKLVFFIPKEYKEKVKKSLFDAGAGKYNNYDMCSYEVKGEGQFRALDGSDPFIGETDKLEKVTEYRIEMLCTEKNIKKLVEILLDEHPYEEPAYEIYKIYTIKDFK